MACPNVFAILPSTVHSIFLAGVLVCLLIYSCKHAKKSHQPSRDLLAIVAGSSGAPLYDEGSESGESSDTGVEMWEDVDALRDEGVEVARQGCAVRRVREEGRGGGTSHVFPFLFALSSTPLLPPSLHGERRGELDL